MKKNYINYNYNKKYKTIGLSLFELILTITISSIVFIIAMAFVNSAVNTTRQLSFIENNDNSHKVVLNILTEDFFNNNGNISIIKDNNINTLTLSFNITDPNHTNTNIPVYYIYDSTYKQLYKKLANENSILLLDNIANCAFSTMISTNATNITLTVKMIIAKQNNNSTMTVYEVINATYINSTI